MTHRTSGYYWAYTLDDEGNPLESVGKPCIVWYNSGSSRVVEIGFDQDLDANGYRLVGNLEYKQQLCVIAPYGSRVRDKETKALISMDPRHHVDACRLLPYYQTILDLASSGL
jgi:hypothetical protein